MLVKLLLGSEKLLRKVRTLSAKKRKEKNPKQLFSFAARWGRLKKCNRKQMTQSQPFSENPQGGVYDAISQAGQVSLPASSR